MSASPEFKKRLDREIDLYVQETKDGCVDCLADPSGECDKHTTLFLDLICNPGKYIDLRRPKTAKADGTVQPDGAQPKVPR